MRGSMTRRPAVGADPDARVVVVQHAGVVTAGTTVAASALSHDLYRRAIEVMAGADALGGFVSLTEAESFAVEYWPLELYKLSLAPPPGELQGAVALVTGVAGGIGSAVATRGAAGIRVNTVNPDAVLSGSRIWGPDSSWRRERAAAYGIAPEALEEHYRARTTLNVNILPEDVAEAVLHFASPVRSRKSTGNVLNVDGGVPAAYSR
jgi:hypothetical protein